LNVCAVPITASAHIGGNETMKEILQYLKTHGERLDREIAEATGIPLAKVRLLLTELAEKREVMACHSIRFEKGKKIEGIRCRLTGFTPPAAPGRKSKAQLQLS
jgi:transcription initiation factor IIE alpha subunit